MNRQLLPSSFASKAFQHPFFRSLHDEIDRAFDRFTEGSMLDTPLIKADVTPALDVSETDDAIEITAEIPGVKESDLDVSVTGNTLVLKGEKSTESERSEKNYHLIERQYGSFRRQVPLGFAPDDKDIKATFADGVLTLNIKKPAEIAATTKKIKIAHA
ncbi:Hsp20/alpha crystallin family protein [Sulfitobacter sabulilitoris]|uniref:Hsp20/alpha crystallin family protein n=1 Tax=Sulfitobacter sabulilitoris TaxID=2562655 RepID=A0A5S3PBZ9_9RHOB|nr:Hsp20/alpha crystallin family protein [Sulfitobacter sabulilitoris]TMM51195.1 Hsp20/alpha crystallin family protein [Sulfitobacter sabulilitoris]